MYRITPFCLVLAVVGVSAAQADRIRVPRDYPNIQTAINFANPGDVVVVSDGVYTGVGNKNIDFIGLPIKVRSKNGPDNCVIDCEGDGRGFIFQTGETNTSVLRGFTIRNGSVGGGSGGGIYCRSGTGPLIRDCRIEQCTASSGGGIYLYSTANATIQDCEICGNSASGAGGVGGGLLLTEGSATITGSTICENTTSRDGGGVYISSMRAVTISHTRMTNNSAASRGGGAFVYSGNPLFSNCLFLDNESGGRGAGLYGNSANVDLQVCTFFGNVAGAEGGGVYASSRPVSLTSCILWGDSPDEIASNGVPDVTYCDVQGGWAGRHNINEDPLFATGPLGDFYLSHPHAGQAEKSPCFNGGLGSADELGLRRTTTRTDGRRDRREVDIGFHYPRR